jgi:hypothetical protein
VGIVCIEKLHVPSLRYISGTQASYSPPLQMGRYFHFRVTPWSSGPEYFRSEERQETERVRKRLSARTPCYPTERAELMFGDVVEASAEPETSHCPVSSLLQAFEQPWREEIPPTLLSFMSSWK